MARQLSVFRYDDGGLGRFHHVIEDGPEDTSPIYRHGAKYGNGGFTGQRCMEHLDGQYKGRRVMFRLDDHLNRLATTAEALEWFQLPFSLEGARQAMYELMVANPDDDYFSLVFASGGDVGVMPKGRVQHHAFINSRNFSPEHPYLSPEALNCGMTVRLTEPDIRRGFPSKLTQAKVSGNYAASNVAKYRALQAGADDAMILDWTGKRVAELSVANVLMLFDDVLITPNGSGGALNGITMQTVMTMAEELYGCKTAHDPIPVPLLRHPRMMLATGTAIGACKIRRLVDAQSRVIWEQPDNDGAANMLAEGLIDGIWRVMRGQADPDFHPEWFTPIPEYLLREQQLKLQFA